MPCRFQQDSQGQFHADRSLHLIHQCEEQDADALEVQMAKGIILKHAGDLDGAAAACFQAQSLDSADRHAYSLPCKQVEGHSVWGWSLARC